MSKVNEGNNESVSINTTSNFRKGVEIIVLVIMLIVVIALATLNKNKNDYIMKSNIERMTVRTEMVEDIMKKDAEIEVLRTSLLTVEDQDALLKQDMELYIKTTHPKVSKIVAHEIAKQIVIKSRQHGIAPELVLGIIKVESSFNPAAVGPKTKYGHARGLMQVMPEWVKKLGLKNQYDFHEIDIAIESGIKVFLIHLEEGKGDISTGLYYYVNKDKAYVGHVYAAMGKFVAFRSTINAEKMNVETDIDRNGDSKKLPETKKEKQVVKKSTSN